MSECKWVFDVRWLRQVFESFCENKKQFWQQIYEVRKWNEKVQARLSDNKWEIVNKY